VQDRVAEILAQRAALDRGTSVGIALSILVHAGLAALFVYAALHAAPPRPATMVSIQFASSRPVPAITKPAARKPAATVPTIEEPKPKIEEPKPVVEKTPPKPEKNTVPLSPFGRSTKKGSEAPPVTKPAPEPAAPATSTAPAIPIGGSGVTGLEGGDFPYTLYLSGMHRRIGGNWFRPQVPAGTSAVIYYRILRDGTIVDAKIETSSGNAVFDRAALSAVRSSSPLTPLPFGYSGTYLGVHLEFR
jgi:periplasmic protein TonB